MHLSWTPALRLLAVRNPGRNQDALCRANVGAFWPRLFGMPELARPNPTACALGENCNAVMAFRTFVLVAADTQLVRLTTRDTVAVETPARRATSLTAQDRCSIPAGVLVIVSSQFDRAETVSRFRRRSLHEDISYCVHLFLKL